MGQVSIERKISRMKEGLDRYKRIFPDRCVGKDDIEILVLTKRITTSEADEYKKLRTEKKIRKISSIKKEKKMTKAEFLKLVKNYAYGLAGIPDFDEHYTDYCYDQAEGILCIEPKVKAYLKKDNNGNFDIKGCLADYLYEYAEKYHAKFQKQKERRK